MEGLSCLLKYVEAKGDIHGIKVCRGAPILSHLLFVNDCFLLHRSTQKEVESLHVILKHFEVAFGLVVSEVWNFFSNKNTPQSTWSHLSFILRVTKCLRIGKNLGLPSMVGRKKNAIFNYIKQRIWKNIFKTSHVDISLKHEEKFLSNLWRRLFQHIAWIFSFFSLL